MKTSLLKVLDGVLYPAACAVCSLFPKFERSHPRKTLVLRPGGMGDLVCAEMALQNLSLDARDFVWLIEKRSEPWALYRGLTYRCYDQKPFETLKAVLNRYSLVINTEQLFGLAQAYCLLARASGGKIFSFATNRGARWSNIRAPYDWRDEHETIAFARLFAQALGHPYAGAPFPPPARLHSAMYPPLVLISGRQSPSRNFTLQDWNLLISAWRGDRSFFIGAAPEDAEFAEQLSHSFGGAAQLFRGSFSELCERMARSEELFTIDGGPVHIASFFGVPACVVFTSGRERKWRPLSAGSRSLRRHDLPCQPCARFGQVPPCPYRYACKDVEQLLKSLAKPATTHRFTTQDS